MDTKCHDVKECKSNRNGADDGDKQIRRTDQSNQLPYTTPLPERARTNTMSNGGKR